MKNPDDYLVKNNINEPINCIEIDTIRITFFTHNLIDFIFSNFKNKIKIKEIFLNNITANLLKYETIHSLNILSCCGFVTKKDGQIHMEPIESSSNSGYIDIYAEISIFIINNLKVNCYSLFDKNIYSIFQKKKNKKRIKISLSNFITSNKNLIKNYKKNKNKLKYYNIYLLLDRFIKQISMKLLAKNQEEVMLLLSSGALSGLQKLIFNKIKQVKKFKKIKLNK